ncbi:hypothetical protein [Desertivirga brevis]|nr:hypothetical protein [Pedobacter sp. SYSU D00873]
MNQPTKEESGITIPAVAPSKPGKSNDPDSEQVEREEDDTALVPDEDEAE